MTEKKDAYQLYNLKLKKEENATRNFITKRSNERRRLLEEMEEEREKIAVVYKEMEKKRKVTPQMIMMTKTSDVKENEKKLQQIQKIEYEMRMLKKEYLKIKNKQEELEKRSADKKAEKEKQKETKEIKRAIEEANTKKQMGGGEK